MSFFDKLFTKKSQQSSDNQTGFDFLDGCSDSCQKWFSDDSDNYSKEVQKTASYYIEEFGLEKGGANFTLLPELKNAIADYFKRCSIKCNSTNVIVRSGIFELLQDLYEVIGFEEGEKVLFTLPISGYFIQQCHDNEIAVEFLNTDIKDGWKINFTDLEAAIQKHNVKVLFLNYPNNTTGAVLTTEEITLLVNVLKKNKDLLLIVDESLREIVLDNTSNSTSLATSLAISLASIDAVAAQIITISSLKCYGLHNLDIAFACLRSKATLAGLFSETINVSHINQHIAIAALLESDDNQKNLADIIEQCRQNADLVSQEVKNINSNLKQKFGKTEDFIKPLLDDLKVGNSMLLQFSGLKGSIAETGNKTLETDLDIAEFLKRETNIAMMPGQCCLLPEEAMILRLYLLKSKQELRAGFKKINAAVMQLKMLSKTISGANSSKLVSERPNARGA
jgi:aspartate/methionine/tyrosine aminotransferase